MTPPERTKRAMVQGWLEKADEDLAVAEYSVTQACSACTAWKHDIRRIPEPALSQAQRAVNLAAMVRDAVRETING